MAGCFRGFIGEAFRMDGGFAARLAAMREERAGRRDCVGKPKAAKTGRPSARAAMHPLQGLLWRVGVRWV